MPIHKPIPVPSDVFAIRVAGALLTEPRTSSDDHDEVAQAELETDTKETTDDQDR